MYVIMRKIIILYAITMSSTTKNVSVCPVYALVPPVAVIVTLSKLLKLLNVTAVGPVVLHVKVCDAFDLVPEYPVTVTDRLFINAAVKYADTSVNVKPEPEDEKEAPVAEVSFVVITAVPDLIPFANP